MHERLLKFLRRTNNSVLVHSFMTGVWVLLLIPTLLWWKESILWVASMSLYANFVGHLSAIEAASAKAESRSSGAQDADPSPNDSQESQE